MTDSFEKIDTLGKGTYGIVYSVKKVSNSNKTKYKIDDETHYALKAFFTNTPSKRTVKNGIFSIREMQFSLLLNHPNVCKAKEALYEKPFKKIKKRKDQRTDKAYLVFDSAVIDLEKFLFEYSLPKHQVIDAVDQISAGLDYIHSQGLMHRDMKLNNILIFTVIEGDTTKIVYKIADLGCIKPLSKSGRETQRDVSHLEYRAIEQLLERDDYGIEIDLWALGILMFEIVTGNTPFRWDGDYDNKNLVKKYLTNRQQLRRILEITGSEGIELRGKEADLPDYGKGNKKKLRKHIESNIYESREEDFPDETHEEWKLYIDAIMGLLELLPKNRWNRKQLITTIKNDIQTNKTKKNIMKNKQLEEKIDEERNKNQKPKTLIKVKESEIRNIAIEFIASANIGKKEHCHCVDLINRITWEDKEEQNSNKKKNKSKEEIERIGAKLAFTVAIIVGKFWKIEEAYKLSILFPDEKKLLKSFTDEEIDEYEIYLIRDVLKGEVFRVNIAMLVSDAVPWNAIESLITGTDLNRLYVEDVASELENEYSKLSPPRETPLCSPSRNMLLKNSQD